MLDAKASALEKILEMLSGMGADKYRSKDGAGIGVTKVEVLGDKKPDETSEVKDELAKGDEETGHNVAEDSLESLLGVKDADEDKEDWVDKLLKQGK